MMHLFISGALTTAYLIAALFFLKYWSATRDRLFAFFSAAFALLAIQRMLLPFISPASAPLLYAVRLVAFVLIIIAIVDKNRSNR